MSLASINKTKIEILRDRAQLLSQARKFFADRGVIEVDCPFVTHAASIDAHIDVIEAVACKERSFLHTSPEYAMKRLLSYGIGDIFQLGHVFRDGEIGSKHNPEFMMAEWYRCDFSFEDMIAETVDFIALFISNKLDSSEFEVISYREALLKFTGIDYCRSTVDELCFFLEQNEIEISTEIEHDKDGLLNVILAIFVEPKLGSGHLTVLRDYPASQAALAKTFYKKDEMVAQRFEVYFQGIELANGYHELADAKEQRIRLQESNLLRIHLGKKTLPVDEYFLKALEHGLPECCGVAVGVDRLMMIRHQVNEISEVIPFGWYEI